MENLTRRLAEVEQMARASKLRRLVSHPFKYLFGVGFRNLVYPFTQKGILVRARTFFGRDMHVALPAGTDIYLTGGKSHDSEIRLAKFIIDQLSSGDTFVDVGAHFGYFSLLASKLVGSNGRVFSFEASKNNFAVLRQNTQLSDNIRCFHKAVSDTSEPIQFFEFPVLFSEYNTLDATQFENEKWFAKHKPERNIVEALTLDEFVENEQLQPKIVKIDVEGAEYRVLQGMKKWLDTNRDGFIVMEYLSPERHNTQHKKAAEWMRQIGYGTFLLDKDGQLEKVEDLDNHLRLQNAESDNLIFKKTN
ncbi:MAG: FkbM family methyltransferase [Saprospiraceae bacterium]|nr:FkbM family methyltransferase [Saprospiraceae bacterium]